MLFHYHFWTPYVEETEKFYEDNGFRISQRIGKYQGDFQIWIFLPKTPKRYNNEFSS